MKKLLVILLAVGILSCTPDLREQEKLGQHEEHKQPEELEQQKEQEQQHLFCLSAFDAEMAAWEELNLSAYRFTAKSSSSTTPPTVPVTVTVLPDTEPEVIYNVRNDQHLLEVMQWQLPERPFFPFGGLAIDEIYASIREIALSYLQHADTFWVTIKYNEKFHYPEAFSAVPKSDDVWGGTVHLTISHFEVLEGF